MLRDLNVALDVFTEGTAEIRAPILPETLAAGGGMYPGIMATLADIVAGAIAVQAVYPDWMATAGLSLHTTGLANLGRVAVMGSLVRAGGQSVIVQADLVEESGPDFSIKRSVGSALISCARLVRREDTPNVEGRELHDERFRLGGAGAGLERPFPERVGIRILDAARGRLELPLTDYVRNSFGALQGGMMTMLADLAGALFAGNASGRPMTTRDMEVHFLSLGKVGPFRATCRMLRRTAGSVLTRVEVVDAGADDRLLSVAVNASAPSADGL
jgi:uncharacterized protein (TIGR00369 family)